MNNLKAKLKKQGGFTLIEMLIVVAFIAILIAVSIPIVYSALERPRESTDAANERSFKAELMLGYTLSLYEGANGTETTFDADTTYIYDASNGCLSTNAVAAADTGYGKSTAYQGVDNVERAGKVLAGKVDDDGTISMGWVEGGSTSADATIPSPSNLISPKMISKP